MTPELTALLEMFRQTGPINETEKFEAALREQAGEVERLKEQLQISRKRRIQQGRGMRALKAERDTLRAEVAALKARIGPTFQGTEIIFDDPDDPFVMVSAKTLAPLRKDAERYRWLKKIKANIDWHVAAVSVGSATPVWTTYDEVIDAAMVATHP